MAITRDLIEWTTDGGMMQITPETKKVSELLPVIGDNAYAIPIYQRGYSWRNEQIDQLFEDIKEEVQGYYVGSLLVSGADKEQRDEIVDGQQRIVTLSLFLLALWEACENFIDAADMHITPNPASVKADIQRQLLLPDGKPRIKLQEDDQRIYESLLSVTTGQSAGRWGNRAFAKRYKHIKSLVTGETFSTFQELTSFYGKINNVEILRITVPDLSDAFSVFSSLNSKGLPLTLIDLLKNEYLRTAITEGESSEKALSKWEELLRCLGKTYETDIDEWTVSQFLLNNFDAFSKETSPTTKGKALSEYKTLFSEIGGGYINQLTANAKVFAQIIRLSDVDEYSSAVTEKLDDLNRLESSQAYPLMLFLLACLDYLEIENQLSRILEFLIVFFVRRNIVLVPKASSVRSRMLQIIKKVTDAELKGDELASCIFSELISISASDAQLDLALDESIYDKSVQTTRFILIDIERRHGRYFTNKGNPDTLEDIMKTKRGAQVRRWTIEHILPEGNLPDVWADMISPDDRAQAPSLQEQFVHLFGNLTLTPYNPELGQKIFKEKRDYYDGTQPGGLQIPLFLNSQIADEGINEKLSEKEAWTPADIRRRNEWFKELILKDYDLSRFTPST